MRIEKKDMVARTGNIMAMESAIEERGFFSKLSTNLTPSIFQIFASRTLMSMMWRISDQLLGSTGLMAIGAQDRRGARKSIATLAGL